MFKETGYTAAGPGVFYSYLSFIMFHPFKCVKCVVVFSTTHYYNYYCYCSNRTVYFKMAPHCVHSDGQIRLFDKGLLLHESDEERILNGHTRSLSV